MDPDRLLTDQWILCLAIIRPTPSSFKGFFFRKTWQAQVNMGWALLIGLRDWRQKDSGAEIRAVGEGIVMWCGGLSVQCLPDLSDTFQAFLRVPPTAVPLSSHPPLSHPTSSLFFCVTQAFLQPPFLLLVLLPHLPLHSAKTLKKTKMRPKDL